MSSGGYADAKIPDLPKVPKASFEQLTLMDLSAVRSTAGDGNRKVSISYSPPPLVRFVKLNICSVDTGDCMSTLRSSTELRLQGFRLENCKLLHVPVLKQNIQKMVGLADHHKQLLLLTLKSTLLALKIYTGSVTS